MKGALRAGPWRSPPRSPATRGCSRHSPRVDVHEITARGLTGREEVSKEERRLAKAVNFGLLYGMSAQGLRAYARASYGIEMTLEEAERYRRGFFETYPGLRAWHER